MDSIKPKPVANITWPEGGGMSYGVRAGSITVYLMCREDSMKFSYIKTPFYPGDSPKDAQLLIVCPLCGAKDIRIHGASKTFQYESIPEGAPFPMPEDPDARQYMILTVLEPCGCPDCKKFFRLTNNVMHK